MTERIKTPAELGVLSDILETLRFRSTIIMRSQLAAPWGFSFEQETTTRFHISIDGCFFAGGEDPVEVGEMEIVVLPNGRGHWIADHPGSPRVSSAEALEACELRSYVDPTGSITNQVLCGITHFDTELSHPLLDALPSLIHFPKFSTDSAIWRLVELINTEAERSPTLQTPIINRLTEVLFLQLLQELVDHSDRTLGFLVALRNGPVRRALELLHQDPEKPWTIDDLAGKVAMSRASLIRGFRESVGVPPIEYLTRWRLLKAHQLIRYSADSIEHIACWVGFSSAQALARAFKRSFGITPSSLRR